MRRIKSGLCIALACILALGLVGCGGENGASSKSVLDKDHVFASEELSLPMQLDNIRYTYYVNDRIYVLGTKYEETENLYLCTINPDGSDGKSTKLLTGLEEAVTGFTDEVDSPGEVELYSEEAVEESEPLEEAVEESDMAEEDSLLEEAVADNGIMEEWPAEGAYEYNYLWYNICKVDAKGNVYAVVENSHESSDEFGNYNSENTLYLVNWNENGQKMWMTNLSEGHNPNDYYYVNDFYCEADGQIIVYGGGEISFLDAQGSVIKKAKLAGEGGGNLYADKQGNLFTITWNESYDKQVLREYDKNAMDFGPEQELPMALFNYGIYQEGTKYDFLLTTSTAVFTYNRGDTEPVKLMDMVDSDLYSYGLNSVAMLDENRLVASYSEPDTYESKFAVFTKVQPEDVKDKQPISLATMYMATDIKKRVIDFNKSNDAYRIQVTEYDQYSTADDYMAGYTRLNNDIVAGNIPDILVVNSSMPFDSYVAKGILTDLNELMDKDPEINREDYLTNILDAFSNNGKLYQLVPSFQVNAVMGKKEIVGDRIGWNMQEFEEVMSAQPEGTASFAEMTRDNMLFWGMRFATDDYVDKNTGKCSFDSQDFIDFLKFAAQFPKEIDYAENESDDYWMQQESAYRENRAILSTEYFSEYRNFNNIEKGTFGADITPIGFPTKNKNGNLIVPSDGFAISAKSKCKDGAWEFLRYYMMDEYQNSLDYQFPIKESVLIKQAQRAMERPYWENEDGTKEYYDDTYYIDGVEIIIDPMTQEEVDEFTAFLKGLTMVAKYDENLLNMVTEEAEPFFEGQKTAEEVAKIIQSRAQLYISESR